MAEAGRPMAPSQWRDAERLAEVLSLVEMNEYRRPFGPPGDGRLPTLIWPRQIPIGGEPADVHQACAAYAAWLRQLPVESRDE